MLAETNPPASAIFWPTNTLSPFFTQATAGAPMCWLKGYTSSPCGKYSVIGLSLLNFEALPSHLIIFLSITLPIIAQLGDLSFSAIKRHYKLKDFGTIFPGHGGVLDRIDSLLFCIIYTYAVLIIYLGPANTFLF